MASPTLDKTSGKHRGLFRTRSARMRGMDENPYIVHKLLLQSYQSVLGRQFGTCCIVRLIVGGFDRLHVFQFFFEAFVFTRQDVRVCGEIDAHLRVAAIFTERDLG
jgi:hypothetical protein